MNILERSTSRNTLRQVPSGRHASGVSENEPESLGPRRLSYFTYNDAPESTDPDAAKSQGAKDLETGATVPYDTTDGTEEGEKAQSDVLIVEWDGDDKELGTTWPLAYRAYLSLLVGGLCVSSTMASSLPSMIIPDIAAHFHVSLEVAKLQAFIFVGGYCFAPLFWAPLSELFGTRWNLILSAAGATIFNMACALAPNIGGLIIFRFLAGAFGSCAIVVGGGTMANIWSRELLGVGMSCFAAAPMAGPALGPLISGWIVVERADWRWGFWACTMLSGLFTALSLVTLRETNPHWTLKSKAKRIREATGDDRYKAPIELRKVEAKELFTRWLILPLLMLIYEPMLQAITLYMSFVYGVLYLFFEAFPVVFMEVHHLNGLQCALTFLGFFIGCIMGIAFYIFVEDRRYQRVIKTHAGSYPPPEERLRCAIYCSPLLMISLFWFAWTSYDFVSIWSPIAASVVFGIAMFFNFVRMARNH